jgi:hypothetical protein
MTAVLDFVKLETRAGPSLGCPILASETLNIGEGRVVRVAHVVDNDNIVAFLQEFKRRMRAGESESADDQDVISGIDILRNIGVDEVIVKTIAADRRLTRR